MAKQQNAASMILDNESPWPVRAFVLDIFKLWGEGNTALIALISEASPIDVEGACALRYSISVG